MPKAQDGILIECDESIKAIILKIDRENSNRFIIEDIDDTHALVKKERHEELKDLLKAQLADSIREPEDSSDSD
ncbi:hypothetical protein LTR62_006721 [Meristemomyces frigidus]|uniref:General transcription and DNA repair factor IIH subunit TFB5 n=1 Tax=Meristemomyces frigidus TaxID=1508187 RepID=A0AAN7THB0_9PEZI|nr:hypothetical protein LTR62_006721 [Meristemomyces frigidus]